MGSNRLETYMYNYINLSDSSSQHLSTNDSNSTSNYKSISGLDLSHAPIISGRNLTICLDSGHSFIKLTSGNSTKYRGFYPVNYKSIAERNCTKNRVKETGILIGSATVKSASTKEPELRTLMSSGSYSASVNRQKINLGKIVDEQEYYVELFNEKINCMEFFVSNSANQRIEKFISDSHDYCHRGSNKCEFNIFSRNCIDFSQSVFEKTDYNGHFIDYFPSGTAFKGMAPAYAVMKNYKSLPSLLSIFSIFLIIRAGYKVSKRILNLLDSKDKSDWSSTTTTRTREDLKILFKRCKNNNMFLDHFVENDFFKYNDVPEELACVSIEIQDQFDKLETFISKHGYKDKYLSYINEELTKFRYNYCNFQIKFRMFID